MHFVCKYSYVYTHDRIERVKEGCVQTYKHRNDKMFKIFAFTVCLRNTVHQLWQCLSTKHLWCLTHNLCSAALKTVCASSLTTLSEMLKKKQVLCKDVRTDWFFRVPFHAFHILATKRWPEAAWSPSWTDDSLLSYLHGPAGFTGLLGVTLLLIQTLHSLFSMFNGVSDVFKQ